MLHLAFAIHDRDNELIPKLISLVTKSKAYHCELRFTDGTAISSTYKYNVYFKKVYYDHWRWVCIPLPWISEFEENEIRTKAQEIVDSGARYDLLGAVLGKFSKKFNKKNDYFCSELCAELISPYIDCIDTSKWYSPEDLWKEIATKLDEDYPEFTDPSYKA